MMAIKIFITLFKFVGKKGTAKGMEAKDDHQRLHEDGVNVLTVIG